MTIQRMDHVGIVVDDLAAATAFFVELGLELQGETPAEGEWVDRIVGLEGIRVDTAMMETPDGNGRLELVKFHAPSGPDGDRDAPANTPGLRHLTFVRNGRRGPHRAATCRPTWRPSVANNRRGAPPL
jgi:catechol 2,3-dioxygenase-like lactoylglutathione lyase family enzyme